GKYIRMALILKLLEEAKKDPSAIEEDRTDLLVNKLVCDNPRCITTVEQELDQLFEVSDAEAGTARCRYCENKMKL
ncbi:MAG: aspartate carbamoyltransferase, partial [Clostridia bacterium]|nr:aspartate carbamoyltransferase [Clostridia bacterium]